MSQKQQSKKKKKSRRISHRRINLIITAGQMMMPETFLDVQLALFHLEIDQVNLLLQR
jgi:chorismate-pyruvate lyase